MKTQSRWIRELSFFLAATAAALVFLPLLVAALAYQSRQAMFWPAYQALYTYLLQYTIMASVALAVFATLIRYTIRRWRAARRR